MPKIYATTAQKIRINDLLREHLHKADGGLFAYAEGWTDERIAAEAATGANPITGNHVAKVREEVFGNIRRSASQADAAAEARIAGLEAEVAALRKSLSTLSVLHERLCLSLSVNKIADVKHLSGTPQPAHNGQPALSLTGGRESLTGGRA